MVSSDCISKLLLSYLLFLLLKHVVAEPNFLFTACNENGNYTQNSLYQKNLHQLLSDLSVQASKADYHNTTKGESPDIVYGTFYCRRDISPTICHDCVKAAVQMVVRNCTSQKAADVWYEFCTLRYAARPFFGPDDNNGLYVRWYSHDNVSHPIQLQMILRHPMDTLIKKAAYDISAYGYATGQDPLTPDVTIYSLVQCSPGILGFLCERCLRRIIYLLQFCCDRGRLYVMTYRKNCQMRYDTVPFYAPLAPPPSISGSQPSPSPDKDVLFYITRVVVPVVGFVLLLLSIVAFYVCKRKKRQHGPNGSDEIASIEKSNDAELSFQYNLDMIMSATRNFSIDNKLGQGGFGVVYKGRLPNGQEVAVKRLSEDSRQGHREFANEVKLVANLQHKNLVKLFGFCLEGEEKLLIYEFVSNLSLDKFLFDPIKRAYLNWETRFKIITGIVRGLLYLHVDSRVKIVHRDLKSSNILLDEEMNPKIADFGLARLMKFDHTQANTSKIFGTFGYMAPEYAASGTFSVKSDVYSFGVMLLEIISGQSNNFFSETLGQVSLVSHASRLWKMGTIMELLDPSLGSNFSRAEAQRCIQVGLVCVQEDPLSRPTMESVLLMLHNNSDVEILPRLSVASSDPNVQLKNITGEHDQDDSQECAIDQPHIRNTTTSQFKDLYIPTLAK